MDSIRKLLVTDAVKLAAANLPKCRVKIPDINCTVVIVDKTIVTIQE